MPDTNPNPRNAFENAVFALGLLLVVALLGALVYQSVEGPDGPADIRASVGSAATEGGGARAHVVVANAGGAVAEDVRVEVCGPGGPTGEPVCAEAQVPYVPAGAERGAVVGFRKAPSGALSARVVSYLEP